MVEVSQVQLQMVRESVTKSEKKKVPKLQKRMHLIKRLYYDIDKKGDIKCCLKDTEKR